VPKRPHKCRLNQVGIDRSPPPSWKFRRGASLRSAQPPSSRGANIDLLFFFRKGSSSSPISLGRRSFPNTILPCRCDSESCKIATDRIEDEFPSPAGSPCFKGRYRQFEPPQQQQNRNLFSPTCFFPRQNLSSLRKRPAPGDAEKSAVFQQTPLGRVFRARAVPRPFVFFFPFFFFLFVGLRNVRSFFLNEPRTISLFHLFTVPPSPLSDGWGHPIIQQAATPFFFIPKENSVLGSEDPPSKKESRLPRGDGFRSL